MYNADMSLTALSHPVLSDGQDIALFPVSAELTVAQAAEFLRMSECRLNDLLNAGHFVSRLQNGLRLIRLDSLQEFEQDRERKHAAVDQMMRWIQEMGLYDD
jgi:hypothetical protein